MRFITLNMNGIRSASDYVRAHPDRKALVICLELSSVNAVFSEDPFAIITHSLFGDGCGAVVIGAGGVGKAQPAGTVVVRESFSHLFDDAEDGIVLGVNDDGSLVLDNDDGSTTTPIIPADGTLLLVDNGDGTVSVG